jgi:carboxyl-terminal processing protease
MVDDKMNEEIKNNDKVQINSKIDNSSIEEDITNSSKDNKFNKIDTKYKKVFSSSETILLVIVALLVGLSIGFLYNNRKVENDNIKIKDAYLNEFIKNYNYILDNYYEEIDRESLVNSAIAGMMESLDDPYSVYIDEEESNNFSITLNGSYQGIGVEIAKEETNGYMLITAIFKDSPANEAGLLPGDMIISVNDKLAKEMTASEFSSSIKNGDTDTYKLKVLRGTEEFETILVRKTVTLASVVSEKYEIDNKKVGYIYIGIFANNTFGQFKKELEKLELENIDYLIIDVRGNTGGHLTAVDGILDLFLNKNQIMYQFKQGEKVTPIYGLDNESKKYKIILLGDESSASASEVLISGLKENIDCIFIGKKTYGKGTVQELVTLSDGTQYKITVKKWLTPKGNWINDTAGINPDIDVDMDKKYYETFDTQDDSQLQSAFEYIKKN